MFRKYSIKLRDNEGKEYYYKEPDGQGYMRTEFTHFRMLEILRKKQLTGKVVTVESKPIISLRHYAICIPIIGLIFIPVNYKVSTLYEWLLVVWHVGTSIGLYLYFFT